MSSDDEFGPREALVYLLCQDIKDGKEPSEEDWAWVYSQIRRNKPATLEQFKADLRARLTGK